MGSFVHVLHTSIHTHTDIYTHKSTHTHIHMKEGGREGKGKGKGRREILQDVIIWINLEDSTLPDINNHRKAAVAWFL